MFHDIESAQLIWVMQWVALYRQKGEDQENLDRKDIKSQVLEISRTECGLSYQWILGIRLCQKKFKITHTHMYIHIIFCSDITVVIT